jgi:RNA polymerase sigma-70 factor (ECF subfamily)
MDGAMSGPSPRQHVDTETLFRSHAPFVARFLYRLGVGADELDDAVQEVFLVAHRNGGYDPGPATETSYLASIAVRAASTHRRRARARRERRADVAPDDVSSAVRDPVQMLETNESLVRLQAALDRLDPDLRAALILVELEGQSCQSVAASLSIPIGTVYWRLHRARKTFRRAVDAQGLAGGERQADGERRMTKMAVRSLLFWRPRSAADDLLEAGRSRPPLTYDVSSAVVRHQGLVRSGAPLPSWANSAAAAKGGALALAGWCIGGAAVIAGAVAGVGEVQRVLRSPTVVAHVGPFSTTVQVAPPIAGPTHAGGVAGNVASASSPPVEVHDVGAGGAAIDPADLPLASPASPFPAPHHRVRRTARTLPGDAPVDRGASAETSRSADPSDRSGDATGLLAVPTALASSAVVSPAVAPSPPSPPSANIAPPQSSAPSSAATAVDPPHADDLQELQRVAAAERLLPTDPARALALVRSGEGQYPAGYLREERRYIGVVALFALGRADEANRDASRFLHDYPNGPFSRQVRSALSSGTKSP